ncbi:MAG: nickel-responsive transcriptional regulator NikR [Candidatus Thermoplasmatota archaeon]|nr:nickel-responsive transcriptional regulator NikR [Euryarchaeota archaeon]MBU4031708.1 nickel-responsive transcriptional regulator NikR [Candidatus Thermoplasmatota archaeon]MBU4070943.1 nickel-responsive transcriptional regulator NikR [Candidatus Thermoplasmatota archaeon]MBU4143998.1 nickel-responsive transcriptional regulator NikR [Candidatus Thermoplasmatota archaeon]MBU4591888.1 nickel-responsive transcriptional regulator NikR [Candidatus Thermoplasmatota archaeon]
MEKVTRIGISIEPELLEKFDQLIEEKQYTNRSEAIRDIIRKNLVAEEWEKGIGTVVGSITLSYNYDEHDVVEKLAELQHTNHRLIHNTTIVRLDEHACIEAIIVQGSPFEIKGLADKIQAIKGVKHAELARCTTR